MTASFRHTDIGTDPALWRTDSRWAQVPALTLPADLDRLVVLAAHPDDETLGAGGLIAAAARAGIAVDVVLATAGEASHPHSPTHPPQRLAQTRLAEVEEAIGRLAPGAERHLLDLADGAVASAEAHLTCRLVDLLGDGRNSWVLAPWQHDGHPDHEAAGRAAATAARRTGAQLLHYPIWWWQWGAPDDLPWQRMRLLTLDEESHAAKQHAIAAHRSQVEPLSDRPGDERLLQEEFLAHFRTREEVFLLERPVDAALDELHRTNPDPWATRTSWYEERKRDLTVAALPRARYRRALEIGCSVGTLSSHLAARCDHLIAVDNSSAALDTARVRLAMIGNISLLELDVATEWPPGPFDLIVVSEVAYFLSPTALDRLIERVEQCLRPDADLVLCHWRHAVEGWPLDGPEVHQRFRNAIGRPEVATYRDAYVELSVFSARELTPPAQAATEEDRPR